LSYFSRLGGCCHRKER